MRKKLKVAIIHDWLLEPGGAEQVANAFCEIFPDADIYTLFYNPENYKDWEIAKHKVFTSILDRIPLSHKIYRNLLPLFPFAISLFRLKKYDLVISSHHSVTHGVKTHSQQVHIAYTHTPMRYAWSGYNEYMNDPMLKNPIKKLLAKTVIFFLRKWDLNASKKPDYYITTCNEVKNRIKSYYGRDSIVIYPPVDIRKFIPQKAVKKEDYYYTVSRLVPYKRVNIIVKAFKNMKNKKLKVAGTGPELKNIKSLANGYKNIEILGYVDNETNVSLMQKAKAFVFAAYEDFGNVAVEAQAAGTPVIAYGKGGALETVINRKTGIFFNEQTPQAIEKAVNRFEKMSFNSKDLINNASRFSKEKFKKRINNYIQHILSNHK